MVLTCGIRDNPLMASGRALQSVAEGFRAAESVLGILTVPLKASVGLLEADVEQRSDGVW